MSNRCIAALSEPGGASVASVGVNDTAGRADGGCGCGGTAAGVVDRREDGSAAADRCEDGSAAADRGGGGALGDDDAAVGGEEAVADFGRVGGLRECGGGACGMDTGGSNDARGEPGGRHAGGEAASPAAPRAQERLAAMLRAGGWESAGGAGAGAAMAPAGIRSAYLRAVGEAEVRSASALTSPVGRAGGKSRGASAAAAV